MCHGAVAPRLTPSASPASTVKEVCTDPTKQFILHLLATTAIGRKARRSRCRHNARYKQVTTATRKEGSAAQKPGEALMCWTSWTAVLHDANSALGGPGYPSDTPSRTGVARPPTRATTGLAAGHWRAKSGSGCSAPAISVSSASFLWSWCAAACRLCGSASGRCDGPTSSCLAAGSLVRR